MEGLGEGARLEPELMLDSDSEFEPESESDADWLESLEPELQSDDVRSRCGRRSACVAAACD